MTSALATAFPSDLLNAIPTETKKTYGVAQNGVYIWGNTYKDRKYLTEDEQKKGLAFMGPMSLEIISGSPMGNDKDYLVWHYEEPQADETLESVQVVLQEGITYTAVYEARSGLQIFED